MRRPGPDQAQTGVEADVDGAGVGDGAVDGGGDVHVDDARGLVVDVAVEAPAAGAGGEDGAGVGDGARRHRQRGGAEGARGGGVIEDDGAGVGEPGGHRQGTGAEGAVGFEQQGAVVGERPGDRVARRLHIEGGVVDERDRDLAVDQAHGPLVGQRIATVDAGAVSQRQGGLADYPVGGVQSRGQRRQVADRADERDGVGAGTADEGSDAGDGQRVAAVVQSQGVGAAEEIDAVAGFGNANQRNVVISDIAGDDVVNACRQRHRFDAGDRAVDLFKAAYCDAADVDIAGQRQLIEAGAGQDRGNVREIGRIDNQVDAGGGSAGEVDRLDADQRNAAEIHRRDRSARDAQRVGVKAAVDDFTGGQLGFGEHDEGVIAVAADQRVDAGAADERVVAGIAENLVVAAKPVDDIGEVRADKHVVAFRSHRVEAVDGNRHCRRRGGGLAVGNGVGEGLRRRLDGGEDVKLPVGVVIEGAVGAQRQQRARCQRDRDADVGGPVDRRHRQYVRGIHIRVVGEHSPADYRGFVGDDRVSNRHRRVVDRIDGDGDDLAGSDETVEDIDCEAVGAEEIGIGLIYISAVGVDGDEAVRGCDVGENGERQRVALHVGGRDLAPEGHVLVGENGGGEDRRCRGHVLRVADDGAVEVVRRRVLGRRRRAGASVVEAPVGDQAGGIV